jgi:transposase
MEERLEVKLLRDQGWSIRRIAKKLGKSRNTVRKIVHGEGANDYSRKVSGSKLDPYKNYLRTKITEENYTNQRLHREIQEMGYQGSYGLVKDYLKEFRVKKDDEVTVRFETLPGQQAQGDWKKFGLVSFSDYPHKKPLSCFSMVLGFSRKMYNVYYFHETLENLMNAHIVTFEYFGGVPREILYDRMGSVVIDSYDGGIITWNSRFLDFAVYYGFKPILCKAYRAQTKGKVERPNSYIERDFFLGRTFKNLDDVNLQAWEWLETVANVRIHGTTREKPNERFAQEKEYLLPLPTQKYVVYQEGTRMVAKDCFISYGGNRYSVPHKTVGKGKEFFVKAGGGELFIYDNNILAAQHKLSLEKGKAIANKEHFKGLHPTVNNIELQRIFGEFTYLGETAQKYLAGMKQVPVRHLCWNVKKILELVSMYSKVDVLQAMDKALIYHAFGYQYIRNILKKQERRSSGLTSAREILGDVFKKYGLPHVEMRSLEVYEQLPLKEGEKPYE